MTEIISKNVLRTYSLIYAVVFIVPLIAFMSGFEYNTCQKDINDEKWQVTTYHDSVSDECK